MAVCLPKGSPPNVNGGLLMINYEWAYMDGGKLPKKCQVIAKITELIVP